MPTTRTATTTTATAPMIRFCRFRASTAGALLFAFVPEPGAAGDFGAPAVDADALLLALLLLPLVLDMGRVLPAFR